MKKIFCSSVVVVAVFLASQSFAAQGWVQQMGGGNQQTHVEWDRGQQHYSQQMEGAKTTFIPPDAQNVRVNDIPVQPNQQVIINSQGNMNIK